VDGRGGAGVVRLGRRRRPGGPGRRRPAGGGRAQRGNGENEDGENDAPRQTVTSVAGLQAGHGILRLDQAIRTEGLSRPMRATAAGPARVVMTTAARRDTPLRQTTV